MASVIAAVRHLARIRYRLLLVNAIVAIVPLVGIAFAELHERQLLAALERDMIHQAQLVRAEVEGTELRAHAVALRRAGRLTNMRIRLLDEHGAVAADSHPDYVPEPIPIGDRVEVRTALAGRYGSATRLWNEYDRVYLFSALPIYQRGKIVAVVHVQRSTHDVKLQLYELRSWLARVAIATLVGTILLSLLFATTISRPLGKLTRRATQIAITSEDPLVRRSDEIGQLARAIATMTEELQRRADDARSLAADISHELKTPLAGIRGAAELLRDGAGDDPEVRERFLTMIVDDAARIDRDVTRLHDLARVEHDQSQPARVELAALAAACASRPWPVPVTVRGVASALGRSAQLAAAIENLVANATQHAEPDTAVAIELSTRGGLARVEVTNRGPALSAAAQRKVWDRFYTTRVGIGGSGIGLAIVKSVAVLHGGVVGVHCANGVTTFHFEVRAIIT